MLVLKSVAGTIGMLVVLSVSMFGVFLDKSNQSSRQVSPLTHITNLNVGRESTCLIDGQRGPLCIGRNSVLFSEALKGPTQISASNCLLTGEARVWCWGNNISGKVGNASRGSSVEPALIIGAENVVKFSASSSAACSISKGGELRCWGNNFYGQIGDGTTITRRRPVVVTAIDEKVKQVSVGSFYSCATTLRGKVYCWGHNHSGQIGDGTKESSLTPVHLSTLKEQVIEVAAGNYHSCALTASRHVYCWGSNMFNQVGQGHENEVLLPEKVENVEHVKQVSVGFNFTCALLMSGSVKCWGANHFGQLGNGQTDQTDMPVSVVDIAKVREISSHLMHSCALLETNTAMCWGSNQQGQLGAFNGSYSSTPVVLMK